MLNESGTLKCVCKNVMNPHITHCKKNPLKLRQKLQAAMLPAIFAVNIAVKLSVIKKSHLIFPVIFTAETAGNIAASSFCRKFKVFLFFFLRAQIIIINI